MTGKKIKFLFRFVHMCFIEKTDCKICVSDGSANALRNYKINSVFLLTLPFAADSSCCSWM